MAVPAVQVDPVFEGQTGGEGSLIKYNPLTNMSSAEVWNFLRIMNVPTNKLHECGYVSIGCEPCTRPVLPNQQEREGRWWWEDSAAKECGLHSGNVVDTAEADAKAEAPDLWADGVLPSPPDNDSDPRHQLCSQKSTPEQVPQSKQGGVEHNRRCRDGRGA